MSEIDVRRINLNLLPALEALLREGGVGAAAKRAHVTQSAMSHSLRKLRDLLGDPLLVPMGRSLVLTPRAKELRGRITHALEALGGALELPRFDPRTSTRTFRIATVDYFELTTLPDLIGHLRKHAPGVRLEIERLSAGHLGALASGDVDAVLTGMETPAPFGVRRRHLHDDPFAVVVRPGHPSVGRSLDLRTYLALGHVLVSIEGRRDGAVDRVLAARGLSRRVALRVPHFFAAPLAVMQSDWIATLPSAVAERARKLFDVRVLAPPIPIPPAGIAMLTPERNATDPAALWLQQLFVTGPLVTSRRAPRRARASPGPRAH